MASIDKDVRTLKGVSIAYITSVPFFLVTQMKAQVLCSQEAGMHVTIMTSMGYELDSMPWNATLKHIVVNIRRKPAPLRDILALFRMVYLLRQLNVQIVHSTTPKAGLLTALAAWLARVPIRIHTFTGQPWVTMTGLLRFVSITSDKLIARLNTRCYADSPSQSQFLIAQKIIKADKMFTVGCGSLAGVDMRRFNQERYSTAECTALRLELGIANNAVVLIFLGRITREKGVFELLSAVRELRSQQYVVNLLLLGPLEIEKAVEAETLLQIIGDLPEVRWLGYIEAPERYLAIADILCLPSYREGFGTSVMEAAAMAVPTVGTQINGLSDAVVDSKTGLLVPAGDATALAHAIRTLMDNPGTRQQMGAAARKRCAEEFDSRVMNQRWMEEYVELLDATQRKTR